MELSKRDVERLSMIKSAVEKGTATTFEKKACMEALNAILEPKCAHCRGDIDDELVIVNDRKFHKKCSARYLK